MGSYRRTNFQYCYTRVLKLNKSQKKDESSTKTHSSKSHELNKVWPPPPVRRKPGHLNTPVHAGELLTSVNWLDAALGVPTGFVVGFILYAIVGVLVQAVKKPPSHRPEMLAICLLGLMLTAVAYTLIGRKYSLFGFTLWFGGVFFYSLMFFLAWCDV